MWRKCVIFFLSVILIMPVLSACTQSNHNSNTSAAADSSAASVSDPSSPATEPAETTAVDEGPGPQSVAVVTTKYVEEYGQLQVIGTNMCDEQGNPVQLKGMSTHGLNHIGYFLTEASVKTLAEDWGCSVIRLAMYTISQSDCYIYYPEKYYQIMCEAIDLCIAQGVYLIVDWHILSDGNPMTYIDESLDFFSRISEKYAGSPNVIYEICNEPNSGHSGDESQKVTWEDDVKPYAEQVVAVIRENDPDNIIIIGSPDWSKDVDVAAADPVEGTNLMYSFHFYAGSHGQEYRDKMDVAQEMGLALFVTEWGTTNNTGSGLLYFDESDVWLDYLDEHMISWCNWSIGSSIAETSNTLKIASSVLTQEEKLLAHWPDSFITKSGKYIRSQLLGIPYIES